MKYIGKRECRVQRNLACGLYEIWLLEWRPESSQCAVSTSLLMKDLEEGSLLPPPPVSLSGGEATQLMDELWKAGVRPTTEATGGEIEAVKYHLEDMRRLVFEKEGRKDG